MAMSPMTLQVALFDTLFISDLSRRRPRLHVFHPTEFGGVGGRGRRHAAHVRRHESARPLAGRLSPFLEPRRRENGEFNPIFISDGPFLQISSYLQCGKKDLITQLLCFHTDIALRGADVFCVFSAS